MMKDFSKVTTITANSHVDDGGIAIAMRATLNEDGTWNIVKNVRNAELYLTNKEACDADYTEFEAEVLEAAQA